MTYNGQTACTTAGASSEMTALRSATEGACANIASGVTDTVKCQNTQPDSVRWLKKP